MADDLRSKSNRGADDHLDEGPEDTMPRWVFIFGIVVLILVLVFIVIHLTVGGLGDHSALSNAPR